MENAKSVGVVARGMCLASVTVLTVACTSDGSSSKNSRVDLQTKSFTNGNFETGSNNQPPPSWTVHTFLDPKDIGVTIQTPQTRPGLNLGPGGNPLTIIKSTNAGPLSQADSNLGAGASLRWPRYGNQAVLINDTGKNQNVNSITQTMTVAAGDVDASDGLVHIRFTVAPVLQNPSHPLEQQPYYFVQLTNVTKNNAIVYTDFNLSAQPGVPWKTVNGGTQNELDYTDWQLVDIAPGPSGLDVGDQVQLELMASGCSQGGHFGKLYVDGLGSAVPGLFVSGTAAPVAPACGNLTYTLTYHNGSASNETGVAVDFTTPPNTTYQSVNAPGLSCTTPSVGSAGTAICTVGNVAAGASGSFQVTVAIDCNATGTIVQGTYDVRSNEETALYGSHIITKIGCAVDADCGSGTWCNETTNVCLPTIANGFGLPTDAAHVSPVLDANCTAQAGALVCTSAVCDAADDKCGYVNAHGPCTVANGPVVCRSAVCDGADLLCGYAVGDGPCTALDAAVVCRSGSCGLDLKCKPVGGCNVDADCSGGKWCNESQHTCADKLVNGTSMPNDPPHTNPTLGGQCSAPGATLVCVSSVCDGADDKCGFANAHGPCTIANGATVCRSAVCDPDLLCGYADGDGPCTVANGPVVCRSGACSVNGVCEPAGGCNVDADCNGGQWCNESAHLCAPKLANGVAMPTDPPHSSPTLDGTCSADASPLVCQSLVCDPTDNRCGYANLDGPCTGATGPTVCRSAICATSGPQAGKCVACVDSSTCGAQVCDPASNTCVDCATDSDCGNATSGQVCSANSCTPGCRGTNGNGCPSGEACSSSDDTIGTCSPISTSTSSSSSSTSSSSSSSSSGSGGTGGSGGSSSSSSGAGGKDDGIGLSGSGIFGCSVSNDPSSSSPALAVIAALALVGARRRRAR